VVRIYSTGYHFAVEVLQFEHPFLVCGVDAIRTEPIYLGFAALSGFFFCVLAKHQLI